MKYKTKRQPPSTDIPPGFAFDGQHLSFQCGNLEIDFGVLPPSLPFLTARCDQASFPKLCHKTGSRHRVL